MSEGMQYTTKIEQGKERENEWNWSNLCGREGSGRQLVLMQRGRDWAQEEQKTGLHILFVTRQLKYHQAWGTPF